MNIYTGDALEILKTMESESVHCCVTSPPYFGLRDYGIDGQIGLEKSPEKYVDRLVQVFAEVRRVLRNDGTLWLNLGDSYWGGKGQSSQAWSTAHQDRETLQKSQHQICSKGETRPQDGKHDVIKPKDLCGIPWQVAFALRADGWYLRSDIIWHKPNPMPESVKDRPTKSHEYIFLLSKSDRYYYDAVSIQEEATGFDGRKDVMYHGGTKDISCGVHKRWSRREQRTAETFYTRRKQFDDTMGGAGTSFNGHSGYFKANGELISDNPYVRNRRSIWTIITKGYKEAHFATFPPELPRLCILAGCPEGGTVLDPFNGAGTTGLVALRLGREYIGIELNPAYVEMSQRRIVNDAPLFNTREGRQQNNRLQPTTRDGRENLSLFPVGSVAPVPCGG